MISWVETEQLPKESETRGKAREVLVTHSMFDPEVFTKAANKNQIEEVWQICLPESMVREVMESLFSE